MTRAAASAATPARDRLAVPAWLLQNDMAMCPCGCIGRRKKGSYLAKTIQGGSKLLQQVLFGEDVAKARGLLSG